MESNNASTPLQELHAPRFQIPSLDGIRALAFLLVMMSHSGFGHIIPGFFGVTIFFFLSGYLITSLLRREYQQTGAIHLKHFYFRRILRILPPMYITLAVIVLGSLALGTHTLNADSLIAQICHVTNYYNIAHPQEAPLAGTAVLWSLAVEEHFYLIYPLIALCLFHRFSWRHQSAFLAIACLGVLAWRCVLAFGPEPQLDRIPWATDTRLDSLLFGCLLALYCNPYMDRPLTLNHLHRFLMYSLSITTLLVTFLWRDPVFRETARYTLQGLALLPLFYLAVVDHRAWWFRWLSWRPMQFLGALSYSLYLIHDAIAKNLLLTDLPKPLVPLLVFAISLAYAFTMYKCIEQPLAKWRAKYRTSNIQPADQPYKHPNAQPNKTKTAA